MYSRETLKKLFDEWYRLMQEFPDDYEFMEVNGRTYGEACVDTLDHISDLLEG